MRPVALRRVRDSHAHPYKWLRNRPDPRRTGGKTVGIPLQQNRSPPLAHVHSNLIKPNFDESIAMDVRSRSETSVRTTSAQTGVHPVHPDLREPGRGAMGPRDGPDGKPRAVA